MASCCDGVRTAAAALECWVVTVEDSMSMLRSLRRAENWLEDCHLSSWEGRFLPECFLSTAMKPSSSASDAMVWF